MIIESNQEGDMKQVRYGIFIPPFGYVYDGAVWEQQRFTQDPTKACLGKSFKSREAAIAACDDLARNSEDYKMAQVAVYTVTTTVELAPMVSPEDRIAERTKEYAPTIELYKTLTAKYDAMSGKEVEDLPKKVWADYTRLKMQLAMLGILP
jgi:hypothetical protein